MRPGQKLTCDNFPCRDSYLQAGPSFFIEKSKRRMIAEDIAAGLRLVESGTTTRAG